MRKRNGTTKPQRLSALCRARPLATLLGLALLVDLLIYALRRLPPIPRLLVYISGGVDDVLDELLCLLRVLLPLTVPLLFIPIMGTPRLPTLWPTRATLVLHSRRCDVRQNLSWRTGVHPGRYGEQDTEDYAPLHEPERKHHAAVKARKREVHAKYGEQGGDDGVWGG